MKKILLILILSLAAFGGKAQNCDSIKIVPNFHLNECRHYRLTQIDAHDNGNDTTMMHFSLSVKDITDNHYRLLYKMYRPTSNHYKSPFSDLAAEFELSDSVGFYDFFENQGFEFDLNRENYKIDEIYSQPFEQPFKAMLTDILLKEAEKSDVSNKLIPDSIKVMIDYMIGGLSHEFLSYLVEGVQNQFGKTFANGIGLLRKVDDDDVIEELNDDGEVVVRREPLDSIITEYSTQAHIDNEGKIKYKQTRQSKSPVDDLIDEQEGYFDSNGWPIMLYKKHGVNNHFAITTIIEVINP